jgi:hypothetical protein
MPAIGAATAMSPMKPMPLKARDLTVAGIVMGVCSIGWLVLPDAKVLAQAMLVYSAGFIGYALYLWRRPSC